LILLNVWKNLFEGLLEDAELGRTLDLRIRKDTIVEAMNHHFELNPTKVPSNELKSTIWDTYRFPKHIEETFSTSFHKAVDSMNKKFVRQGKGPLIVTKSKKG
jgi:aromatic ring-opening dioxygenase catalytic subunit (LigB family)